MAGMSLPCFASTDTVMVTGAVAGAEDCCADPATVRHKATTPITEIASLPLRFFMVRSGYQEGRSAYCSNVDNPGRVTGPAKRTKKMGKVVLLEFEKFSKEESGGPL